MKLNKENKADLLPSALLLQSDCCESVACVKCGNPTGSKRKKYCSESCKYWYNLIRKEKESHLAPLRKRTDKWFYIVTGSKWAKSTRQGKRCGHMVTGGMAAMVNVTVEQLVEVNEQNILKHFAGIPGYEPSYMRLGNQERVYRNDILQMFGVVLP